MSKKNRKKNTNKTGAEQSDMQVAVKSEDVSSELIQTPEIKEIQERNEAQGFVANREVVSEEKTAKGTFVKVLFGGSVIVALLLLAICLYKTSGKLQSVQAMSGALQTDLKNAQEKIDELLKREASVLPQSGNENGAEADSDQKGEQGQDSEDGKKPRVTPEPDRYTVCIDAGHGAHDTGAVLEAEDGTVRYEKDDNLRLAKLVQKELEAYGIKVLMTREDDSFLELYDRTLFANSMDVDALISLHRNAYYLNGEMNDRVGGVEIWIHSSRPTEARQLANRMLDAILDVGGMNDRGVRYGSMTDFDEDYAINRRAAMTSMIVEMGFISNPKDNAALDTNGEAYAKAIAKEIYDWLVQ